MSTYKVLQEVYVQRTVQDNQWGEINYKPPQWSMVLSEAVGEMNSAILQDNRHNYREKLIEIAAFAASMVESFDRGNW